MKDLQRGDKPQQGGLHSVLKGGLELLLGELNSPNCCRYWVVEKPRAAAATWLRAGPAGCVPKGLPGGQEPCSTQGLLKDLGMSLRSWRSLGSQILVNKEFKIVLKSYRYEHLFFFFTCWRGEGWFESVSVNVPYSVTLQRVWLCSSFPWYIHVQGSVWAGF